MRRLLLPFALGGFAFLSGYGAACKGTAGTGGAGGEDTGIPALADVVYEGGATDEALQALLDATPTQSPTDAANFTSPTNGAVVPSSPAPTFVWAVGAKSTRYEPMHFDNPLGAPRQSVLGHATNEIVRGLFAGIPEAHAHGTPTSGPAYFILFSTSKNAKLLRVFTANLTYTPDAASLAKLTGAGEAIHAIIENAQFDQNRIAQDGGPFQGTEIVFTLQ